MTAFMSSVVSIWLVLCISLNLVASSPSPAHFNATVSCYNGVEINGLSLDNTSTLLAPGFLYCAAVEAVGNASGQPYILKAYFGVTRFELGDDGSIMACAEVVREFDLFPIGPNQTVIGTARSTHAYCCLTSSCNAPGLPITNTPSPPPPAEGLEAPFLPPPPRPAPPLAVDRNSKTLACYDGAELDGVSLYNTSLQVMTNLDYGYVYCVSVEAVGVAAGRPYTLRAYFGIPYNETTPANITTCAEVTREFERYPVWDANSTVAGTATAVRSHCCYSNACNAPGKLLIETPPPAMAHAASSPKMKHSPSLKRPHKAPCKTAVPKPVPYGRRWAA